ncbi:hypothetical protein V0288_05330 [Pannus brasiliensis CCIBt3594]|uniref:Transporter n=1 Tax=Pannus brasiliensis CCIBt3594 TaxID=1427578 RepID=A0AAW9QN14_9CHRO
MKYRWMLSVTALLGVASASIARAGSGEILPATKVETALSVSAITFTAENRPTGREFSPATATVESVPAFPSSPDLVDFSDSTALADTKESEPSPDTPDKSSGTSDQPEEPAYNPPIQLFNLETGNQLAPEEDFFSVGLRWFFPRNNPNGTGLQVVTGYYQRGVSDRLQVGLNVFYFDDNISDQINGQGVKTYGPLYQTGSFAPQVKYQIVKNETISVSAAASVEVFRLFTGPGLFNNSNQNQGTYFVGGALQVPVSYQVTPTLQLHFTPGFSFLPDTVQGADYYGTSFNVGAGISWQPIRAIALFGDVNYPIGPGGNTVRASDGSIENDLVWSAGIRVTQPRTLGIVVGFDVYATNAFGTTLATRSLSLVPGSGQVALGANVFFQF